MGSLEEAAQAIRRVAEGTGRSVVGVGHRRAIGSGVVLAGGRVLTNAHNLRGDEATISFGDGRTAVGRSTGVDVDGDLAVVEVDTGSSPPVEWVSGARPQIGDPVFALANPGGRGLRVTLGFVTGTQRSFRGPRGRRITGSVEHTAPLLPGSSGGPIVDEGGRMLGLNTNRLGEGFYLALPADDDLRARAEALARGERPARPRLGVGIAPAEVARGMRRAVGLPEIDGVLVRLVEEGSPADQAGLAEGDLIVTADGRAVGTVDDLHDALDAASGSVALDIVRGTEERSVSIALAS
jgi:serine protease Do